MNGTSVTVGIPTFNRAGLLRETIESVLGQTYSNFRLIVSDNASTDETQEVVATLSDARLGYVRADKNIGMNANFNRLIELTESEFLMLLPDDDLLYPEYLNSVIKVLERNPRVGLVHTAFDVIDIDSRVQKHAASLVKSNHRWKVVEPGRAFLERSMTAIVVCQTSATFRTRAIREAGGMRILEEPFADISLFMRIAQNWDIAYLDRPLAAVRIHDQTETRRLAVRGESEPGTQDRLLTYGRIIFDRRIGFLDAAGLPSDETRQIPVACDSPLLGRRGRAGRPVAADVGGLRSDRAPLPSDPDSPDRVAFHCRATWGKSAAPHHLQACVCRSRSRAYLVTEDVIIPW